jgi:hypothetical protein
MFHFDAAYVLFCQAGRFWIVSFAGGRFGLFQRGIITHNLCCIDVRAPYICANKLILSRDALIISKSVSQPSLSFSSSKLPKF